MSTYIEIHLHLSNLVLHHTDHNDPFHNDMREFVTNKFIEIKPHYSDPTPMMQVSIFHILMYISHGFLNFSQLEQLKHGDSLLALQQVPEEKVPGRKVQHISS